MTLYKLHDSQTKYIIQRHRGNTRVFTFLKFILNCSVNINISCLHLKHTFKMKKKNVNNYNPDQNVKNKCK